VTQIGAQPERHNQQPPAGEPKTWHMTGPLVDSTPKKEKYLVNEINATKRKPQGPLAEGGKPALCTMVGKLPKTDCVRTKSSEFPHHWILKHACTPPAPRFATPTLYYKL